MATESSHFDSEAEAADYEASRVALVRGRLRSASLIIFALP